MNQGAQMQDQIAAPVAKAASALGAGAGTSMMTLGAGAAHFLPQDLAGWLAALASLLAAVYSAILLGEWIWKKIFKPRRPKAA